MPPPPIFFNAIYVPLMEYNIGGLFSSDGTDISISSPTESGVQQTIYQYDHTCWSQNIVEGRKVKIHKLNLEKKNH